MRTEPDAGANYDVSSDVCAFANLSGRVNNRGEVNAGRIGGRLVEKSERPGECQVGVLEAQGWGGDLGELGFHEDGGCVRRPCQRGVTGVGDKGDLRRTGGFNAFYTSDFNLRITAEFRAQPRCQLA